MMNSVVEKLVAIEREVATLQPKMAPLTERIAALDQKVTGFAQQLTDLAAESAAVKQDIELTQQGLARIQTLIGESKLDSEQLAAEQEENQQRYKAMESFVGTLYQLHSQSVQIAQWLGLADQAKAMFPAPPSAPTEDGRWQTADGGRETASVSPSVDEESSAEPVPEEPVGEPEPPMPEEPMPEEPPAEEPSVAESILSESDFDSALPDGSEREPEPWAMPGLPDVATPPEMEAFPSDSDSDTGAEPSCEMASQLDVPPLNLAVPAMPEQNESEAMSEQDEQEIEDMLANMMAPVTVGQEQGKRS